ncbi:enzymatic polyprotein [Labeo rohita]|uniref:Enzymatic polyprotein n=1 Tax=Labeo rohita TaxID=84645 RepID=A0ABQ8LKJ9_LABRO|nr:enzymatic polyprotein [Labeo rohita]
MSKAKHKTDKSKPRYKPCVPPCSRFIPSGDTHSLCVVCLGADHAESALEGANCPHCERLPLRALRSRKALFKEGAFISVPRGSGPASAEAEWQLHSWGSQLDLLEGMETGEPLSPSSPSRSGACSQGSEARSAVSSPPGTASTLRISSSSKVESECVEVAPHSPQYEELLEVVTRVAVSITPEPAPTEVSRSWGKPFSARLFVPTSDYYGNVAGTTECGYRAIPRVEQTLASYLTPEAASSLKAPVLPSKLLRTTSALVETAPLRATKETARAIGRSMASMVAVERHLWLTLSDMKEKHRVFLLDAPLAPSGLFSDAVNSVVDRYQEARKQVVAFQRFLPRRVLALGAAGLEQPQPSTSSSYRASQKQSVASQAAPQRDRDQRRSKSGASKPRPDLRVMLKAKKSSTECALRKPSCAPCRCSRTQWSPASPYLSLYRPAMQWGAESLEQLVRSVPAGVPLQGTELAVHTNPEASLKRLVLLVDYLAAWKLLPNVSAWVLRTVERGNCIQLGAPPPTFNGVFPTVVSPEQGLVMEQEVEVEGHRGGPSSRQGVRVLQLVLHCSEEGWRPAFHFRSETTELFSFEVEVQNADYQSSGVTNQVRGLVCDDRSRRCLLPRLHPSSTQEVPEVCFQGRSIPILGSSIWPSTLPPHFHEFLCQGPVLGAPCRRVTLATDASLTGWGSVMSGHPARGLWSGRHLTWHINCLEMLAVFRALKHFLPDLIGCHVLFRTDNTAVVYYINHQGGLRSRPLYKLAHQILVWHPEVVKQIWRVFGQAQVDLFATQENAQCPDWYSLTHPAPLGLDAMVQTWPRLRLYAFPPDRSAPGSSEESAPGRGQSYFSSPVLAGPSLVLGPDFPPRRLSMGDSHQEGSPLSGGEAPSSTLHPLPELWKAPSTRKLYPLKWKLFTSWCGHCQQDPVNCPVGTVLEYLQDRFSAGLAHSTLKVYVAAIAAYHAPLGGMLVGKDPLVVCFLLRLRPPVRHRVPTWDLAVVLEALCWPPFESIEESSDHHLSIKTVLLLALTSLKRVGDPLCGPFPFRVCPWHG